MSIGHDAADAAARRAQGSDSHPGNQGERSVEVLAAIPEERRTGADDARSFAHIWQLFGYALLDRSGANLGPVARIWTDSASGRLKFVGLSTGRLRRQTHVIPAGDARIDDHNRSMKLPYRAATIRTAPHHNSDVSLKSDQERKVYDHYDNN